MIGPTTREPLITVEPSASAPGRSSGLTSDGTIADQAGALSALPMPTPSAAANSHQKLASTSASVARSARAVGRVLTVPLSRGASFVRVVKSVLNEM